MKNYTDIEQSKKLAEILPLESADMCYRYYSGGMITGYGDCVLAKSFITGKNVIRENDLPCWSLAALFDILPKDIGDYRKYLYYDVDIYHCGYIGNGDIMFTLEETKADNPIDACYEMILKLHEFNLL